jgi:hypothetical protein
LPFSLIILADSNIADSPYIRSSLICSVNLGVALGMQKDPGESRMGVEVSSTDFISSARMANCVTGIKLRNYGRSQIDLSTSVYERIPVEGAASCD